MSAGIKNKSLRDGSPSRAFSKLGLVVAAMASAGAANAQDLSGQIEAYLDEATRLQTSLSNARYNGVPESDIRAIEKRYNELRAAYVSDPMRKSLLELKNRLSSFTTAYNTKLISFVSKTLPNSTLVDPKSNRSEFINNFNRCVRETKGFNTFMTAGSELGTFNTKLAAAFAQPMTRTERNASTKALQGVRKLLTDRLASRLNYAGYSWRDQAEECCVSNISPYFSDGSSLCTAMRAEFDRDPVIARADGADDYFALTPSIEVFDPLSRVPPARLAEFLRSREYQQTIAQAKRHAAEDLDYAQAEEERAFLNAEAECQTNLKKAQKDASPINGKLLADIGKVLKCSVIPSIGAATLGLQYQRMTTAVAAVPLDLGNGKDLNCDPAELAAIDASRTADPAVLARQLNLDMYMETEWTRMMRNLQPVQGLFPILPMPGGGLATPFGSVEPTAGNGIAPNTTVAAGGGSRSNRGLIRTSGRGISSGRALASRATPRRIVQRSQAITLGVRRLGSRITNGEQRQESINQLASTAVATRTLTKKMEINTRALGDGKTRRASRAKLATTGRALARTAVTARASRATATGMAQTLGRSNRGGSAASGGKSGAGGLGDLQQQNDDERERIARISQSALGMIESYKQRSIQVIGRVQEILSRRDQLVAGILPKLMAESPAKQADIMKDFRNQLTVYDGEMGTLKSEYDVLDAGARDQSSLYMRLNGFNAMAFGGGPALGGSALDPRLRAPAADFPGLPSPTTWRQKSTLDFLKAVLLPIPVAVANSQRLKGFGSEAEWRSAWDHFRNDFKRYIGQREREERDALKAAAIEIEKQRDMVSVESAYDSNSETLLLMDTYNETVLAETEEIIRRAQAGAVPLPQTQLSALRKVKSDAQDAQDAIDALHLMYKDSYPTSVDENPEVWWGMLPELLVN